MNSQDALTVAVLRLNADIQQNGHVFPLDTAQLDELREAIVTLTDLRELIADSDRLARAAVTRQALDHSQSSTYPYPHTAGDGCPPRTV